MIPQIDIRSALGRIGIKYTPLQLQIHSRQADLSIDSPAAQLSIHYTPGDLEIDQHDAFNQEGLMSPLTLAKDRSQNAEQTALKGVVDRVQWGNQLADLSHHSADLAQYAMRYRTQQQAFAPMLIPGPFSVHVSYQLAKVTVDATPSPIQVSAQVHKPNQSVQYGTVDTYVDSHSSIVITPPALGLLIDTKI